MTSTRDRIVAAGMRLFGEQGYAGTSVAQIEQAAGLSPGSGSLYKHFKTKEDLLVEGVERVLATNRAFTATMQQDTTAETDLRAVLIPIIRAGLARMQHDRDISRLLFRGLEAFPKLFNRFGHDEIRRNHAATAQLLQRLSGDADADWDGLAAVVVGATAHYWLLTDLFGGTHPSGVGKQRFIASLADLTAAFIEKSAGSTASPGRGQRSARRRASARQ